VVYADTRGHTDRGVGERAYGIGAAESMEKAGAYRCLGPSLDYSFALGAYDNATPG
jgi:hypothetical protein